jgi:hypothetical protein
LSRTPQETDENEDVGLKIRQLLLKRQSTTVPTNSVKAFILKVFKKPLIRASSLDKSNTILIIHLRPDMTRWIPQISCDILN